MPRPRQKHYEPGAAKAKKVIPVRVSVSFSKEQAAEIDLRADALGVDRSTYIKIEFLRQIGWVDQTREMLEQKRAELAKKESAS